MLSFVLVILGLWVALIVIRYVITIVQLLKIEMRVAPSRAIDPEQIPTGARELLDSAARALVALGFARPLYAENAPTFVLPGYEEPEYTLLLDHSTDAAIALIRVHEDGSPYEPTRVTFMTRFEDGKMLQTVNAFAHLCFAQNSETILADPYALDLAAQWNAHSAMSAERGVRPILFDAELLGWFARQQEKDLAEARDRGELTEREPGRFVLGGRAAFSIATRMIRETSRVARHRKERAHRSRPIALPLDVQVSLYRRMKAFQSKRTQRGVMLSIFVASALLSLISFVPLSQGFMGALLLAAVVLFHELGHYVAMRAFSYKDTSIFFLPFFGGATIGAKENVKPAEEMIVLLAGPVPGLIAGIAMVLAGWAESGFGREAALLLISLNALNLLPIFPLDGGRIARSLVFSRSVALDVIFQLGAVVVCFLGAWAAGSWLIALPGLFTLLGLSRTVRVSRIAARVNNATPRDLEVLRAIDGVLPPHSYFSERFALARMIERHLSTVRTSLLGGIGWGAVYSLVLAAGIGGTAFVIAGHLPFGEGRDKNIARMAFEETPAKSERRLRHNCGRDDDFSTALELGNEQPGVGLFICAHPKDRTAWSAHAGLPHGLLFPAPWDSGELGESALAVRKELASDPEEHPLYARWLNDPQDTNAFVALRRLAGVSTSSSAVLEANTRVLVLEEEREAVIAYVSFPRGISETKRIADWFCSMRCASLDARVKTLEE